MCVPSHLGDALSGDGRQSLYHDPERLSARVGIDDGESLPMVGRIPFEGRGRFHHEPKPAAEGRLLTTYAVTIAAVVTVAEITGSLAEKTKPENAAAWDPVGLQLGDPSAEVSTVAVCHEVTEEVVARLEERPVDLLVTYHPLLFSPTNRLVSGRSAESRAYRLIRLGVSLVVTHTDFDVMDGGTADSLGAIYRLRNVVPFGADEERQIPAIGRVGDFDGNLGVLDAMTADAFGSNGLRVTGDRHEKLRKVAVVPGSGSDLIEQAAMVADAMVTGDVSHHRAVLAADLGLAVVDPGHIATERPGMRELVRLVDEIVGGSRDLTRLDPTTWS